MKKLIYPAVFALCALGLIAWPDREEPRVPPMAETPSANGMAQDSRAAAPPVDAASRTLSNIEFPVSGVDLEYVKADLSGYSREELAGKFNPEPVKVQRYQDAMTSRHPLDRAKGVYESQWGRFVESLDLPTAERDRLRDRLIAHDARNIELRELFRAGEISSEEFVDARTTLGELAESLSGWLSEDQIDLFWDHRRRKSEEFRQWEAEYFEQEFANGVVGILDAASRSDAPAVRAYIGSGADVNATTGDGRTPLHYAAERGSAELTEMLLAAGANPNMFDGSQSTPLKRAAGLGDVEMIRVLAAAGADVDLTADGPVYSPLGSAALYGQTAGVVALLEVGADATGEAGTFALNQAVRFGDHEMERVLIEAGAKGDMLTAWRREFRDIGRALGVVND